MYGIETPHDFADYLTDEDSSSYWPDDVERPDDVEKHPAGQTYVSFSDVDQAAETALYVIQKATDAGLRAEVHAKTSISIFPPRPKCAIEGCYGDAKGSKPYRDLCPAHAREAKHEELKTGAGGRSPEYFADDGGE